MGNMNKVILVGYLGHAPEIRYTPKGNAVLTLNIATHREFKTAEGTTQKETHWHKATLWGKRAEASAKYLEKGSRVFLEGELQSKTWTDKEGQTRKSAEILVDEIRFLGRRKPEDEDLQKDDFSDQEELALAN